MSISESTVDNPRPASEPTEPTSSVSSGTSIIATPKRKRGRKARRINPYPSWADSTDLESTAQESSTRLFAMYASLPSRVHRRPAPQLSPISHLPNELLVQILARAITRPKSPGALPSQFVFTVVCRTWYYAVMSTPACWTTLHVSDRMPITLYRTCIDKSFPYPFYVEFFGWRRRQRVRFETYREVMEKDKRWWNHGS
ncbi:hypothetical protein BDN67DRAFT_828663 [Paxillus ammoniavirescens]|nr:hypothetical protein BDN67DRAFT_828663 [Paxillus ammoniavirescens]